MPTALRNNQHELCDNDGEKSMLLFGTIDTQYLTTDHPTIEGGDARYGDVDRVREDGTAFGEDFLGGKTATFSLAVLTDKEADRYTANSDALAELEGVWTDPVFRSKFGKVAVLRSSVTPGRTRRAYGRPRRYSDTPTQTTKLGWTNAVVDFLVADGTWYDDTERYITLGLVPPYEGGIVAPLVAPLTTTAAAVGLTANIVVGGWRPTWPVFIIQGPVTDPQIKIGNQLTVTLLDTIPQGMSVTVDPRPWVRTVLRSDGASRSGKLKYDTPPMRSMKIPQGTYTCSYKGTDVTGLSTAQVRWRDAYPRW